jgi:holin-like protein
MRPQRYRNVTPTDMNSKTRHDRRFDFRRRCMDGLAKIFVYLAIGDVMVRFSGLPVPGPVVGLGLMLTDFIVNKRIDPAVAAIFDRVSGHFSVLFVPAGAGVLAYGAGFGESLPVVVAAVIGGTAVTLLVTAGALTLVLRWREGLRSPPNSKGAEG